VNKKALPITPLLTEVRLPIRSHVRDRWLGSFPPARTGPCRSTPGSPATLPPFLCYRRDSTRRGNNHGETTICAPPSS
jgi:hypothetical protein